MSEDQTYPRNSFEASAQAVDRAVHAVEQYPINELSRAFAAGDQASLNRLNLQNSGSTLWPYLVDALRPKDGPV